MLCCTYKEWPSKDQLTFLPDGGPNLTRFGYRVAAAAISFSRSERHIHFFDEVMIVELNFDETTLICNWFEASGMNSKFLKNSTNSGFLKLMKQFILLDRCKPQDDCLAVVDI